MPVVGVNFRTIEARRYQDQASGKVRVDHNSTFLGMSKEGDNLRVEYAFTTSYGPVGMVKIEGTLLWKGDVDAALAEWTEKRALPQQAAQEVHSGILGACVPEAVFLARDLRLPPPMPIPQVKFQQKGDTATAAPYEGPDAA